MHRARSSPRHGGEIMQSLTAASQAGEQRSGEQSRGPPPRVVGATCTLGNPRPFTQTTKGSQKTL